MQRFDESGRRVLHASHKPERAAIQFFTGPGPEVVSHGAAMPPDGLIRNGVSDDYFQRTSGAIHWGAMSLPVAEMEAVGSVMAGIDLAPPSDPRIDIPQPAALAKLRRLHAAAGQLAEEAPEVIENPAAARGLEQALIAAMVGCIASANTGEDAAARRRHEAIMRRFHRALEADPDRALYLPELCAAIGVPERTLRVCCQEHLGMGPKRYLLLRRLHLARQSLSDAVPGAATVTDIATRFGFWQFGRFAGEYRAQFGEAPSATLRRPPT